MTGRAQRLRRWAAWVVWAIAVAVASLTGAPRIAWAAGEPTEAAEKQAGHVVVIPRLGPLLLVGDDAKSATHDYVDRLVRRAVFAPANTRTLREWSRAVVDKAPEAPTLEALRATGRPVVGIQLNALEDLNGDASWMEKRASVATAVVQAGGVPLFLPPAPSKAQIRGAVAVIDHLILMGGADVSPALQPGVTPDPRFSTNLKIDAPEQDLIKQALDAGLGIHAICRGSQLLQVTFGGKLIQDIPTSGLTDLPHGAGQTQVEGDDAALQHPIRFTKDSAIGQALGRKKEVRALHNHHQAVHPDHVAPGFAVVATARDGIPEAIEGFDGRVIGVQVHPEAASRGSALRKAFFGVTLMERARRHMATRGRPTVPTLAVGTPRALTHAIHATVGAGTQKPTRAIWRAPVPPVRPVPAPRPTVH